MTYENLNDEINDWDNYNDKRNGFDLFNEPLPPDQYVATLFEVKTFESQSEKTKGNIYAKIVWQIQQSVSGDGLFYGKLDNQLYTIYDKKLSEDNDDDKKRIKKNIQMFYYNLNRLIPSFWAAQNKAEFIRTKGFNFAGVDNIDEDCIALNDAFSTFKDKKTKEYTYGVMYLIEKTETENEKTGDIYSNIYAYGLAEKQLSDIAELEKQIFTE